ncbi:MAG TPA: PaaI family thioesterase [Acidimicrobiia bacterium]|nr:PaaI family thioesterase [Acidimicrobiia bacterium]
MATVPPEQQPDLRAHWQDRVPYNKACGMEITRWDGDGVTIEMPDADWLMNGLGMFHGGAVAALCDTAASGAVMAGHAPGRGRLSTISMTVQYLAPATGRLRAEARCTKRGRQVSFAEVTVTNPDGNPVARAIVSVTVAPLRSPRHG